MRVDWFTDWATVSAAFTAQVQRLGGVVEKIETGQEGPAGEQLSIHVGVLGRRDARRCVMVSSGLHGVEGIAGSAIQRAWLDARAAPDDCRLVFLHLLDPFGFAWQRRVDAENIDLNRNFLRSDERYEGAAPAWDQVRPWLSPQRAPRRFDPLLPHVLATLPRIGRRALMQAVAGGQHVSPDAVFFGGAGPSVLQRTLRTALPRLVGDAREVLHVDLHTGVGSAGELQVFLPHVAGTPEAERLVARFGDVARPAREQARYYRVRGGMAAWALEQFEDMPYDVCFGEFGTVSPLGVLRALRRENSTWFHSDYASPAARRAREQLVEAFAPAAEQWRTAVVSRGVGLIDVALAG